MTSATQTEAHPASSGHDLEEADPAPPPTPTLRFEDGNFSVDFDVPTGERPHGRFRFDADPTDKTRRTSWIHLEGPVDEMRSTLARALSRLNAAIAAAEGLVGEDDAANTAARQREFLAAGGLKDAER